VTPREIIFAKLRQRSSGGEDSEFSYARDSFSELSSVAAKDRFVALATAEKMSVEYLADPAEVPAAVDLYLRAQQLPGQVVVDTSACLPADIFIDVGLAKSAASSVSVCTEYFCKNFTLAGFPEGGWDVGPAYPSSGGRLDEAP
jgi:hypothetical protein